MARAWIAIVAVVACGGRGRSEVPRATAIEPARGHEVDDPEQDLESDPVDEPDVRPPPAPPPPRREPVGACRTGPCAGAASRPPAARCEAGAGSCCEHSTEVIVRGPDVPAEVLHHHAVVPVRGCEPASPGPARRRGDDGFCVRVACLDAPR